MPFAFTIGALALGLLVQCVFPKERGRERILKAFCAAAVFIVAAPVLYLIAALAVFLLGNPSAPYAWLWYIGALLVTALLVTSYRLRVKDYRFSLYYLWLPLALGVILVESL